jgi:hypothetical protein
MALVETGTPGSVRVRKKMLLTVLQRWLGLRLQEWLGELLQPAPTHELAYQITTLMMLGIFALPIINLLLSSRQKSWPDIFYKTESSRTGFFEKIRHTIY